MTDILQEQLKYYRARAAEYNEWWYREGRYDRGAASNRQWFNEVEELRAAVQRIPHQAHILELAAGTGLWTRELLKIATHVTAVDASPEVIAINRAEVASDAVTYLQADLFNWTPPDQYDMVFFSFWLSHVPPEKLAGFLDGVAAMLKPGGRLFMIDSRRAEEAAAADHHLPDEGTTLQRKLNDGSVYRIVKVFYTPEGLQAALNEAGLTAEIHQTEQFFIYAEAVKD